MQANSRQGPQGPSRKARIDHERQRRIDLDNQLLLRKMININMRQEKDDFVPVSRPSGAPKSLNIQNRKKEFNKIAKENEAFLKRLQAVKPTMSRKKWDKERKDTEKHIKNICQYPTRYTGAGYTPGSGTMGPERNNQRTVPLPQQRDWRYENVDPEEHMDKVSQYKDMLQRELEEMEIGGGRENTAPNRRSTSQPPKRTGKKKSSRGSSVARNQGL